MDSVSEKIQGEAWARIQPFLKWHRVLFFLIFNFLMSKNFEVVTIDSIFSKPVSDLPEVFSAISKEILIRDIAWTTAVCFFLVPWLSSRVNWVLISRIQVHYAKPLIESVIKLAERLQEGTIPTAGLNELIRRGQTSRIYFSYLKTLCETWIFGLILLLLLADFSFGSSALIFVVCIFGFFGISQIMMIVFLRHVIPGSLAQQIVDIRRSA